MVGLYKLLLLFLLLPAHWIVENKVAKLEIVLTNIKCENYMPSLFTNLTCALKSKKLDQPVADMEFFLVKDIYNMTALFSIKILRGNLVNNINVRVDYGAGISELQNYFVSRIIFNDMMKHSNFPLGVSWKKNKRYYIHDFKGNGDALPKYVPELNFTSTEDFNINQRKGISLIMSGRVAKVL